MPTLRKRVRAETPTTEPVEQTPTKTAVKKSKRNTVLKREPVRIPKYYFAKAVKKIRNYGSKKKRKHPLIERFGASGTRALGSCHSCSIDALNRSLVQPVAYTPTWNLLVKMLRKALLARNWSYCLRLYDAHLKHGSLRRQHLLYLIKLTFLLMFNLNVSSERLNNFLTVTLSMRSREDQEAFLWSLIELKRFSNENPMIVKLNDRPIEDDSEDIVPSDEDDDPDNIVTSDEEDDPENVPSSEEGIPSD